MILVDEAVRRDLCNIWVNCVRLINRRGQAETCVCNTLYYVFQVDDSPLTIGRPVSGFCCIVDPKDRYWQAPTGYVGEIFIQVPTILRGTLLIRPRQRRRL